MAEYASFFNSKGSDRPYNAKAFRQWSRCMFNDGVSNDGFNLNISFDQDKNEYVIDISEGIAYAGGAIKYIPSTHFTAPIYTGTYGRTDAIVIRADDNDNVRDVVIDYHTYHSGEPVRTSNVFELVLYRIDVPEFDDVVDASDVLVTDYRSEATHAHCGLISPRNSTVDMGKIYEGFQAYMEQYTAQKESEFVTWFAAIKNIIDSTDEGNIVSQADTAIEDFSALDDSLSHMNDRLQTLIEGVDDYIAGKEVVHGAVSIKFVNGVSKLEDVKLTDKEIDRFLYMIVTLPDGSTTRITRMKKDMTSETAPFQYGFPVVFDPTAWTGALQIKDNGYSEVYAVESPKWNASSESAPSGISFRQEGSSGYWSIDGTTSLDDTFFARLVYGSNDPAATGASKSRYDNAFTLSVEVEKKYISELPIIGAMVAFVD